MSAPGPDDSRGRLGLEPDPNLYIGHLVQVFREALRMLADDGVWWLNLGDAYAAGASARAAELRSQDPLRDYRGEPGMRRLRRVLGGSRPDQ